MWFHTRRCTEWVVGEEQEPFFGHVIYHLMKRGAAGRNKSICHSCIRVLKWQFVGVPECSNGWPLYRMQSIVHSWCKCWRRAKSAAEEVQPLECVSAWWLTLECELLSILGHKPSLLVSSKYRKRWSINYNIRCLWGTNCWSVRRRTPQETREKLNYFISNPMHF